MTKMFDINNPEFMTGIYSEFQNKVMGYLVNKINNVETAEDLCGDVFVKVYSKIESYDPDKSSLSTWIYNITRNTLYDYFRTNHVHEELDEELSDSENSLIDEICTRESLHELALALKQLDDRDKTIIIGHYYERIALKDIAEELGISYSYVKMLHANALIKLKEYMKKL